MVDSLFFCTTLTGRRGGFVQAGAEMSDTGMEVASSFLFHLHAPQPPPKNMEKSQHHSNSETWQGR